MLSAEVLDNGNIVIVQGPIDHYLLPSTSDEFIITISADHFILTSTNDTYATEV